MREPCPFCGSTEGRSTAEHWLPRSWEKYLPVPTVLVTSTYREGEPVEVSAANKTPFGKKHQGVCEACNNVWLREIDEAAQDAVLAVATGKRAWLHASELGAVAMHLTRAALVMMWGTRGTVGLYPQERLREFRQNERPPEGTRIFAAWAEDPFVFAGGRHYVMNVKGDPDTNMHFASWTMGRLFALVIIPTSGMEIVANTLARLVSRHSERTVRLIWPEPFGAAVNLRPISAEIARRLSRPKMLGTDEPFDIDVPLPEALAARFERLERDGALESLIKFPADRSQAVPPDPDRRARDGCAAL